MSEYEDLDVFGAVASSAKYEEIHHQADKTVQGVSPPGILSGLRGPDRVARNACSACPDEFSAPTRKDGTFGRVARRCAPTRIEP